MQPFVRLRREHRVGTGRDLILVLGGDFPWLHKWFRPPQKEPIVGKGGSTRRLETRERKRLSGSGARANIRGMTTTQMASCPHLRDSRRAILALGRPPRRHEGKSVRTHSGMSIGAWGTSLCWYFFEDLRSLPKARIPSVNGPSLVFWRGSRNRR